MRLVSIACGSLWILSTIFRTLQQVYNSTDRLNHIFDVMGPIAPVAHVKDIKVENGLVLHINEEMPGEGELDLAQALRRV